MPGKQAGSFLLKKEPYNDNVDAEMLRKISVWII